MLLVDHDQTEVFERREEGGTGADDDLRPAFADAAPLPPTVALGKGGMEDRSLRSESPFHRSRGGRREADLRHQNETAPPIRQNLFETPQIDLCLARSGDALEQEGCVLFLGERCSDRVNDLLLFAGQNMPVFSRLEDPAGAARRRLLEA